MRLPDNDDDGAVPLDQVISVLRSSGVTVLSTEGRYYLSKNTILEVQELTDPVRRKVIHYFSRKFEVSILRFYYPDVPDIDKH